jgi:Flp pilus assembly pilin Flp
MSKTQDLLAFLHCRLHNLWHDAKKRLRGQDGATTVEYVLLIAVIVIGIIAAATYMFDPLKEFFQDVVKKVKDTAGLKKSS